MSHSKMDSSDSRATTAVSDSERAPRIWAVGGGKGGIGKSFISANLGVAVSRLGKRVVLVDLDLGGANLHTSLGHNTKAESTLSDYFNGSVEHINTVVCRTDVDRLGLICGTGDARHMSSLKYFQKAKLLRNLKHLDADYVILDLGAGTSFDTLDFFVQAERGLVVVTPDPASIENTYRFLKCALMRKLKYAQFEAKKAMNEAMNRRRSSGERAGTLANVLMQMDEEHPQLAAELRRELVSLKLHLIVNQVHEPGDTELGHAVRMTCNRYFDAEVDYLGYLQHDQQVLKSLRQRRSFVHANPQSRVTIHLEHMASTLISQDEQKLGPQTWGPSDG